MLHRFASERFAIPTFPGFRPEVSPGSAGAANPQRRIRAYRVREHGDKPADASLYANYCIAGKFAQLQGVMKYWWNRLRGKRTGLIEYKGPQAEGPQVAAAEGGKP